MNILVLPPFNEAQRAVIESAATGASFTYASSAEATDEATGEIDCIMRWRAGQS